MITPSHNPPEDGGFKYNPPHGGPADTEVTRWIEAQANRFLSGGLEAVSRIAYEQARRAATTHEHDFVGSYVNDLASVVDMDLIRGARLRIGVDPLGGASVAYWGPIAERYGVQVEVVNDAVDPAFGFMSLDWDGRIRMDCSSPYAMSALIALKDRFDIAFGNDPDADRHGIVTRSAGLMNPNHYLAAAIFHLFNHRPGWRPDAAVGKTVVSSSLIDRVAAKVGRALIEVPVGFKWFVPGLLDGSLGFGGEESAGAAFLRRDGSVWSTDKDGIIMDLLAVELMARTGRDPSELYQDLTRELGAPVYQRIDAPATANRRRCFSSLRPGRQGHRAGRRPDSGHAHHRARQRRGHRRFEGRHRARMVRGAPLRHRGGLQAVRGELSRGRTPAAHPGGGTSPAREGVRRRDVMASRFNSTAAVSCPGYNPTRASTSTGVRNRTSIGTPARRATSRSRSGRNAR